MDGPPPIRPIPRIGLCEVRQWEGVPILASRERAGRYIAAGLDAVTAFLRWSMTVTHPGTPRDAPGSAALVWSALR